jgi:leader peptidase (prepilin peptidase)/N-methyltransferase
MMTTPFGLVVAGVLGALVGSFLNVVVYRVPRDLSVVRPRSACPSCGRAIRPWENVPILSYAFLLGRCAGCKARIAVRYPIVEALTSALFVGIVARFGFGPALPFLFFFAAALVAVAWIDFDFRIIPDELSLGGLAVGLVGSFFLPVSLPDALVGAFLGGGILWGLGWAYRRATGIEGMGGGDVKLAAMIGAFLGPGGVVLTLFLASLLGTLVGGGLMLVSRAGRRTALPFGTFLAPAALVALFLAPLFFAWYGGLFVPR